MSKSLAIVVGAGEGLGVSLLNTLSGAGYQTVGINRTHASPSVDDTIIIQLDVSDSDTVKAELSEIIKEYGVPKVVIFNTAQLFIKPFLETPILEFELAWRSMVLGTVNVLHTVLPSMLKNKEGCIVVSGATGSIKGGANFSAFSSAKFSLRGLTQSLAREYQKQGIHFVHVVLDGILDTPRSRTLHAIDRSEMMSTNDVADAYLRLINQPRSAWSLEVDLRPYTESF